MIRTLANAFLRHRESEILKADPNAAIEALIFGGGAKSHSGEVINTGTSLTIAPVWQALTLITGDMGRMPFKMYRTSGDTRQEAKDHSAYRLLRRSIGQFTSNIWIEMIVGHALMYGNGYSRIIRGGNPYRPVRLEWLHSDDVQPQWQNGKRYYIVSSAQRYHENRSPEVVTAGDMFHIPGLQLDELGGLSIVHYARHCFGRHISTEKYTDEFWKNDATPAGWFTHPATMSQAAQERFLAAVRQRHGAGNRHTNGILEDGMKYEPSGVSPEDALLIDQLKWDVPEVARFFNIPSHKLNDANSKGYNTTEQENKSYYNSTLGRWVTRLEYEAWEKLLTEEEKDSEAYEAAFETDSLFRADTLQRYQAHGVAIQWGIKNRNEVRREEHLNPYEGGDEFLVPLNMTSDPTPNPEADGNAPTEPKMGPQSDDGDDGDDEANEDRSTQLLLAKRDLIAEPLRRMAKRLAYAGNSAAKKPDSFLGFINDLETSHRSAILEAIGPAVRLAAAEGAKATPEQIADRLIAESRERMLSAADCQAEHLAERVTAAGLALADVALSIADQLILPKKGT